MLKNDSDRDILLVFLVYGVIILLALNWMIN
jgi:hypothetical protein